MSESLNPRFQAMQIILNRQIRKVEPFKDESGHALKVSQYFGVSTLGLEGLKNKLSSSVYDKLMKAIEGGKKIDLETANTIASKILEWALEKGATHFCHWFQPQTGLTAEKHDSFLSFITNHQAIEKFSGSQLIQSEPDASSFPSGGMRSTFEARGYTAWDPSSPFFLIDGPNGKTLCIPSVFVSYNGEALDEKTPLLRSIDVLNKKALAMLQVLGEKNLKRVYPTVGAEQEYFLIDKAYYVLRPDLVMTGRTLLGSQPPRGQQLEDHYFGSVPDRVLAFMQEVEMELYRLGVPVKTRHNEVAPSQYETAPIFEDANLAADHNQITMEVMKKVATKHGFVCLFHEKPFFGVNGSGKHCNWSIASIDENDNVVNLLDPGSDPHQNIRFLVFLSAILKGVYRHAGVLRAAIATPGNDFRLGANEAPPAIISVFLGDLLSKICQKIESGTVLQANVEQAMIELGVSKLPLIAKDNTDRNRTSPFAFTGNKFEFRAVGASMPISFPITVLNTAVAQALDEMTVEIKKKMKKGKSTEDAALEVVKEALIESHPIRFEGNNYSEAWVREAENRGLPNLKTAPNAIEYLKLQKSKELFTETKVLSEAELMSRIHIMHERYIKKVLIEVETLISMLDSYVLPACLKEQKLLIEVLNSLSSIDKNLNSIELRKKLQNLVQLSDELLKRKEELQSIIKEANQIESDYERASMLSQKAIESMQNTREVCDSIEKLVSNDFWNLPKYSEMLFLN
jgi:glutamine synthetase